MWPDVAIKSVANVSKKIFQKTTKDFTYSFKTTQKDAQYLGYICKTNLSPKIFQKEPNLVPLATMMIVMKRKKNIFSILDWWGWRRGGGGGQRRDSFRHLLYVQKNSIISFSSVQLKTFVVCSVGQNWKSCTYNWNLVSFFLQRQNDLTYSCETDTKPLVIVSTEIVK